MRFRPLAATLLCAAPLVNAQEAVEPVIVTASRVAESADETLAAVTVINRQQIEASQAQSLSDLLRALPGVTLISSGGRGKLLDLMLRGTGPTHTLILVDGIKIGSATNGQAALQDIPAAQIERIEIVRGPRSSLYGSEAIGGVVQIFTRRAKEGLSPNASLTVGSFGTRELSAGFSGSAGNAWYNAQAQRIETEGFDVCPDCNEPDDDGYRSGSGSVRAGYRFASGLEAEVHALRSESYNEFDGAYQNETESLMEVAGARLGYEFSSMWHATLTAGQSRDQSSNYGTSPSDFDTAHDSAALQNDITVGDHLVTIGVDYQADRVESGTSYDVTSRLDRGTFAQYRTTFGSHDLQVALRGDDDQQFGYHRTGNLAWGAALGDGIRLTAAYGTAFKAPTFNELYWPGAGNPDLQPETAASGEVGLHSVRGPVRVDLRLFRTDVDHLINWACTANCNDTDYSDDVWQPMNVDRARIDGAELAIDNQVGEWTTHTAITFLDPRDEETGNLLPRRARESLRVDLDRRFDSYSLGATLIAEGKRFDDVWNTEELPGYATLDLRGDYPLSHDWHLGARIENVFDQEYRTAANYAQPERSYYLTVGYRP